MAFLKLLERLYGLLYRKTIFKRLRNQQLKTIDKLIDRLYSVTQSKEVEEVRGYLKLNPPTVIPYSFIEKYNHLDVEVHRDSETSFWCVKVDQNNIYFPGTFSKEYVIESIQIGLMEQDEQSPHRYVNLSGEEPSGKFAVLIGASNCLFALTIIENFEKIYLFEIDVTWHLPMSKTMQRYKDKIEVVPKFVDNIDTGNKISLDTFFDGQYNDVDFIQADIEGSELHMLQGAEKLLKESLDMQLSVCCYHTSYQETEIKDFFRTRNYSVSTSEKFIVPIWDYPMQYPYLRRGVIYAKHNKA